MSLADVVTLNALKRCAKAAELIYAGQFEQAGEMLGNWWRGVGERPTVDEYPLETGAEILLQCGALSSLLGQAQGKNVHEKAKDLLSEALHVFQTTGNQLKVSEANYELGCSYFRAGAYDEGADRANRGG
jgi:hypothetical protein